MLLAAIAPDLQAESAPDIGVVSNWYLLTAGVKPVYLQQAACHGHSCYSFGGFEAAGAARNGMYLLGTGEQFLLKVDNTPPPPRGGGALMAFGFPGDQSSDIPNAILFGGTLTDGTHIFDAHLFMHSKVGNVEHYKWEKLTVNGTNNEVSGFGAAWDPLYPEFYTFFGFSGSNFVMKISKAVVDTEALTITWSDVVVNASSPIPPPRFGATCQHSAATKKTLCVGGNDGVEDLSDIWSFDHAIQTWTQVILDDNLPSYTPRTGSACHVPTFPPVSEVIECYGGLETSTLAPVNDTTFLRVNMTSLNVTFIPTTGNYLRGGAALLNVYGGGNMWLVGGRSENAVIDGDIVVFWTTNSSEYATQLNPTLDINPAPDARADMCSVVVGNGAIVAFGRGVTSVFNDVYYHDASQGLKMFYEISVLGEGPRPSPRYGASATASATTVYFFGGVLEDHQTLTNELWRLNVNIVNKSATWELVTSTAPATARAFHSSSLANYRIFVVGGMLENKHTFTGDMSVFEMLDLTWRQVSIQPPLPPRAAHGFTLSMDSSTFTIIGGRYETPQGAIRVLGDIHQLDVPRYGVYVSNHTIIRASGPPVSDFTVASFGDNILVCGGIAQSTQMMQSVPENNTICHFIHINAASKQLKITPFRTQYFSDNGPRVAAGAWAMGKLIYIFGGNLVQGTFVPVDGISSVSAYVSVFPDLYSTDQIFCATGQIDDSDCLHCAAGYTDSPTNIEKCVIIPVGYYATRPYFNATPCPPGTYSNLTGATTSYTCQQCSAGTYSSEEGSTVCLPCTNPTCPIGSTDPNQASTTIVGTSLVSQQPEEFAIGVLPSWMWSLIGVLVFCGILLVFVPTLVSHRLRENRRASYFPADSLLKIRSVYELHKLPHFGVNPEGLQIVLKELGVRHFTQKYARAVMSENDQDGTGHLTFPHLLDVIIQFIDKGFLPPFTTETYAVSKLEALLVGLNLKAFDAYDKEHSLGVNGDQMRYQTTRMGGIFRIVFFVVATTLVLLLCGQFYYTSIIEDRSMVPIISRKFPVQTQSLSMQFTATGGVHSESSCQQNNEGMCVMGVNFTLNSGYADKYASLKPTCSYNATAKSCTLQLSCAQCSFNFNSNVVVSVLFPPEVYASSIEVGVSAYTGIHDSKSSVEVTLQAPSLNVFRGFPATTVDFTLTPTHFTSVNNVIQQQHVGGEGYHADYVYSVPGQSVEAIELSRHLGVPIVLQLDVSGSLLEVSRLPQSSLLDLASQLLGSLSGMGGVLLLFMGIYDRKLIARRYNKVRMGMENDMCDGNGVMKCTADDHPSHHNDNSTINAKDSDDSSLSTALVATTGGYHHHEPEEDDVPENMNCVQEDEYSN